MRALFNESEDGRNLVLGYVVVEYTVARTDIQARVESHQASHVQRLLLGARALRAFVPDTERTQIRPHLQTLLRQLPRPFTFQSTMAVSPASSKTAVILLTNTRMCRVGVHLLCAQRPVLAG